MKECTGSYWPIDPEVYGVHGISSRIDFIFRVAEKGDDQEAGGVWHMPSGTRKVPEQIEREIRRQLRKAMLNAVRIRKGKRPHKCSVKVNKYEDFKPFI